MILGGHQSDKLTDEDISHQSTLNCRRSTPKVTVAEADDKIRYGQPDRSVIRQRSKGLCLLVDRGAKESHRLPKGPRRRLLL
jgi:hypothetical protein